ncbi:MAG: hypothetical protein ABR511_00835 [Acidimicrobiales bacterium]
MGSSGEQDGTQDDPMPAAATPDEDAAEPEAVPGPAGAPADGWRREVATGAVTAALAAGLRHARERPSRGTVPVELDAPTRVSDRDRVQVHFDPVSSRGTRVVVRRPPPSSPPPSEE